MSKGGSCRSRITSNSVSSVRLPSPSVTVIAELVAHIERLHGREHAVAALGELVGGVIGQLVAARLRFQQQREGGIAADIDPLDRVHLDGDIQGHGDFRDASGIMFRRKPVVNKFLRRCCRDPRARSGIPPWHLFELTIAAKLYAIFALLATVTVAIALVAVASAAAPCGADRRIPLQFRRRTADRTGQCADLCGGDGIRGPLDPMRRIAAAARVIAARLIANNDRLGDAVTELQWEIRPEERATFEAFTAAHQGLPGIPPRTGAARHRNRSCRRARIE